MTLETHEYANLIPNMTEEEYASLLAGIRAHGLLEPITLYQGKILDGRHRYRACLEAHVEPRDTRYTGDDPISFVVSKNLERRHLSPGQSAAVGFDIQGAFAAQAAQRRRDAAGTRAPTLRGPGASGTVTHREGEVPADLPEPEVVRTAPQRRSHAPESREQAAAVVGVSPRLISSFGSVARRDPELANQVRRREITVGRAESILRVRREAEARQSLVNTIQPAAYGDGWEMVHGDFREELSGIAAGSIDAIVTDPPYSREFLSLWGDLAQFARRVLKPKGLLIALSGTIMLTEVIEKLEDEGLSYGWIYAQPTPGQSTKILARHVFLTWKPWLVYSNGTWPSGEIDWHEDTTPDSTMHTAYAWQQDGVPAKYLIEKLTPADARICDPMTGTGTYGRVAVSLGRTFIGCELDEGRFRQTVSLLQGGNN